MLLTRWWRFNNLDWDKSLFVYSKNPVLCMIWFLICIEDIVTFENYFPIFHDKRWSWVVPASNRLQNVHCFTTKKLFYVFIVSWFFILIFILCISETETQMQKKPWRWKSKMRHLSMRGREPEHPHIRSLRLTCTWPLFCKLPPHVQTPESSERRSTNFWWTTSGAQS